MMPSSGNRDLTGCRILVVMPSIPVQGMERGNLQIMKMMLERGADVMFVTNRDWGQNVEREVGEIGARFTRARIEARLVHLPRNLRDLVLLMRSWAKGAWDIDCAYRAYRPTHIYVTDLAFVLYALPTLIRSRRPSIFYLPVPPDLTFGGFRRLLLGWLWIHVISSASTVLVANSEFTKRQMQRVGIDRKKLTRIHYCLPERGEIHAGDAPNIDPDKLNVVFLGRVSQQKGVRELVDAAYHILQSRPDVDFYIAGEKDWMNPFAEALQREVKDRGLDSRICFLGEIRDVMALLSRCHVHVVPTITEEPFGLVVLEAKSMGVPSVVFPSGGLVESVMHLEDGYICREKSVDALAEGIEYFIENREARVAAGSAARKSLERFAREVVSDEWTALFRSVTQGARRGRRIPSDPSENH